MLQIFLVIAPLFLVIALGALLRRVGVADQHWQDVLNQFAFKIGFPALIFGALAGTGIGTDALPILGINSIFLIVAMIVLVLIGRIFKMHKVPFRTMVILVVFGNVAYLGLPVLTQVWGDGILPEASLIIAVYLFWIFTLGVGICETSLHHQLPVKKLLKSLVTNPLLLAVAAGLAVSSLRVPIPGELMSAIKMLAAAVTPLVLFVIGLFLGAAERGTFREWVPVFGFSLFTLLVLPACLWGGLTIFDINSQNFAPSIVQAAMPVAITPFALAHRYRLDSHFIARSIVLTTILSIFTLPLWVWWLT